jgi:hypothetical protein
MGIMAIEPANYGSTAVTGNSVRFDAEGVLGDVNFSSRMMLQGGLKTGIELFQLGENLAAETSP